MSGKNVLKPKGIMKQMTNYLLTTNIGHPKFGKSLECLCNWLTLHTLTRLELAISHQCEVGDLCYKQTNILQNDSGGHPRIHKIYRILFFLFLSLWIDQWVNSNQNTKWIWDVNSNFFENCFSANEFATSYIGNGKISFFKQILFDTQSLLGFIIEMPPMI